MPSINFSFVAYWTLSYYSHPHPSPDKASGSDINPTHELQNLKRVTINGLSRKNNKTTNLKIKISCPWLNCGFCQSLTGSEGGVGSGQQCLHHIHALCAVLQGGQRLSAFDFPTTLSSFSACTQPQGKTSSTLHILFPTWALPLLLRTTHLLRSTSSHSPARWAGMWTPRPGLLGTASQISPFGDTNLFLPAES